jgi:teichuronic acid biosynthesis glycosyltransferase TuaH
VTLDSVALISLEAWDAVWRRNQHLATELTRQGLIKDITFVNPPSRTGGATAFPEPGVRVVTPRQRLPKRLGGLRQTAMHLRSGPLGSPDLLWINNATLGIYLLGSAPAVYDVTDDWRTARQSPSELRRLVRAEDVLARQAKSIVCSKTLAARWHERYDVRPPVIRNAADVNGMRDAEPVVLPGDPPHVGYVGTLHAERLDIDLVIATAQLADVGTLHLVGPNSLDPDARRRLADVPKVRISDAVPAAQVAGLMKGMDVLVCPHQVTEFTLSLDAIKAYEYRAAGRPVVATPTSGFQELTPSDCLAVESGSAFLLSIREALSRAGQCPPVGNEGWDARAREFAAVLASAQVVGVAR